MTKLSVSLPVCIMLLMTSQFGAAQGSADQYKKSPTNPSGLQYDNFSPKEKPLAPAKAAPAEEHVMRQPVANDYMSWPHKKEIDDLRVKGVNALTEKKLDKAEKCFNEAIQIIGIDNYISYREATYTFRPDGFFQELYFVRERKGNFEGAINAADSMMIFEPDMAETARRYKTTSEAELKAKAH